MLGLSARRLAAGAVLWAGAMGLSAWLGLWRLDWQSGKRIADVAQLFFFCGLAAFPLATWLSAWLARRWSAEQRFAIAFLALAVTTIGLTAVVYAIQYRLYYSEWHDHPFTMRWVFEVGFTTLAAMYQFAVTGMRLYFPLGFAALLLAGFWFARQRD